MPKPRLAQIFERDELDWYVDPERCTEQLLAEEDFPIEVHDPCCGGGNIVLTLRGAGYVATGSDLVRRCGEEMPWWRGEQDFLVDKTPRRAICMNPPYFSGKGTEAFIRHALTVTTELLCVFVDRRFLTGARRAAGLWRDHPPTRVWEITPRPSCPPGEWLALGNVAGGGTADYCWLVWDLAVPSGRTELGWLCGGSGGVASHSQPRPDAGPGNHRKPRRRRT